jgi:phage shock protein A
MKDKNDVGSYVRRVQEGTQRYAQDVLTENERLRMLVTSLEGEKLLLSDKAQLVGELAQANEALRTLAASLETETRRLQEHAVSLRVDRERYEKELARLQTQLDGVRDESERYSARYAEVEQQNSNLANLYVASYRLHGTLSRKEVLDTIQEIVANLIGSEEAALFEVDGDGRALNLAAAFGIGPERRHTIRLGEGLIGRAAETGEIYVVDPNAPAEPQDGEEHLTACIPLVLDGRVSGAIAIFRLLPQKAGVEDVDRELFDLLATHAATALYCTKLHQELGARVEVGR